jgi:hypothetical protein
MKIIFRLTLAFSLFGLLLPALRAADRASVQGILIIASNEPGKTDRRLASYEPTLRRILRFESYQYAGDDSTSLDIPANGRLSLGHGHDLQLTTESSDGRSVHLKVEWTSGGRTLMNTGLVLRPGVPAVLGGPATGNKGEVYAVILIGR